MADQTKKRVPDIRFKGCSDEWEKKELGEVLTERKILQKISDDAPILAFAAGQGVIDRSERRSNNRDHLTRDQANKIYKLTEYDDIVYNPANLKYGAIDRNKHGRGVISPIYVTFITEEDSSFIELIVKSEKFKLKALQYEEGTVVKRQSVKPENLLSLDIQITPNPEEQKQIGLLFQKMEEMIELHQRKHEKLVTLKKAMLKRMFPQNGSTTPEIRFKGFSEPWEEKKIGEIMINISNNALSRAELNYKSGLAKNVHYGDILVKFGEILNVNRDEIPFISNGDLVSKLKPSMLQDGDIIIADAAEDESVGKCTELINVDDEIVLAGLHTIALRPIVYFAPMYLGYFMNSHTYHDQLLRLMQGTKVLSISKSVIKHTSILSPIDETEQQKIGTYFHQLDELIAHHETKVKKLKQIKIACLGKMFV